MPNSQNLKKSPNVQHAKLRDGQIINFPNCQHVKNDKCNNYKNERKLTQIENLNMTQMRTCTIAKNALCPKWQPKMLKGQITQMPKMPEY